MGSEKATKGGWPADQVQRRPLAELIPYARNARTHSEEQIAQIAASMREWGWTNPVLVDEEGLIIAGHGRVSAARLLGWPEAPVMVAAGWSEAQKRAYTLADNKLALNAGWDAELLALELGDLVNLGMDPGLAGFTEQDLARVTPGTVGLTDPDQAPPVPAEPVSRLGDVWLLGRHRLVCGDATVPEDWTRAGIGDRLMVFTSPPYGVGEGAKLREHYERGKPKLKSLYKNHEDRPEAWLQLMRDWTALAIAQADVVICNVQMLAANKRMFITWLNEFAEQLCDVAVWDKGTGPPQMQQNVLTNIFEWLVIFGRERPMSRSVPLADFHGSEGNVVRIGKNVGNEFSDHHKATMPVAVAQWAISLCGTARSVMDPFAGTGTTIIAAEMTGHAAHGIELDPGYSDVAVQRWQAFAGKTATLESTGRSFEETRNARPQAEAHALETA